MVGERGVGGRGLDLGLSGRCCKTSIHSQGEFLVTQIAAQFIRVSQRITKELLSACPRSSLANSPKCKAKVVQQFPPI